MNYKLFSDAAINPKTLKSGAGVVIIKNKEQFQLKTKLYASDNHTAEFKACIFAFETILRQIDKNNLDNTIITYYTDSKLLANSLNKEYAKHYQNYVDKIIILQNKFRIVFNNWIPEAKNKGAHNLAQQALHKN